MQLIPSNDRLTLASIQRKFPDAVKVLGNAPVLYCGWECDPEVCLVEFKDGSRKLVATNHGSPYIADRKEFEEKLLEYRAAIEQTEALLSIAP